MYCQILFSQGQLVYGSQWGSHKPNKPRHHLPAVPLPSTDGKDRSLQRELYNCYGSFRKRKCSVVYDFTQLGGFGPAEAITALRIARIVPGSLM